MGAGTESQTCGRTTGAAVWLRDVTIAYDRHPIIHHLSGEFRKGSLTALLGPNGAGKSTLLKAIAGLVPWRSGTIWISQEFKRATAFLPQAAEVDRSFPISVTEVVDLGHWRRIGAFGRISAALRRKSLDAIAMVGLGGMEETPIHNLSLGQLQRVLFARLIVQEAPLVLLDEPFNGVDFNTVEHLMAIVAEWAEQGRTVIAALHDLDLAKKFFPQTLLLARELVAWGPTLETLTQANLQRAAELARAWSAPAEICRFVA